MKKKQKESVVRYALDLELEQSKTNPQTPDSLLNESRIIQIGVVFFDVNTGLTLDYKNWYINIGVPVSQYIRQLTNIKQENIDSGVSIDQAYSELLQSIEEYDAFKQPVVWGSGDLKALQKEVQDYKLGRAEFNTKALWQSVAPLMGFNDRGGLGKSLSKLGIQFKGRPHDAVVDAYNTAVMYLALIKRFNIKT